ncbi:MAG TPA: HDIG domain-containing protein [Peptococcaceae bacterium]|jgi:putative nucleotidyltransferase with HDIG domain|nr:HDIG domain-containing protein [Clostridia bacterium]HOB82533.1 HDIG domain-containing protein [Peptococcaceae bacterium]HPZ72097.1 HDIG domain-containing protein [Peptococcaceae bacterium]HQD54742.1 HDIG domain-containing protein [Peptococcaceae bacterium]
MEREAALKMLKEKVTNQNLLKHMYAAEAVMKGLAQHFGEDEKLWGLAGLLHDIDYDETKDDLTRHSLVAGRILKEAGFPEELIHAVICHNDTHGEERKSLMDKALYATDPVTGLIVAGALIRPEKKLAAVDVPFLLNRYHEKSFARGARREVIASCTEMGLSLEEFLGIALAAMQDIHGELGL